MSGADPLTVTSQAFRERAGEAWASLQEQTDAQLDPFGLAAIDALHLRPGERVLDVGCGCGQTLLELAAIVGPRGHVLGVDISEPMLERARQRVAEPAAIEIVCANAETHPFAPADLDAVFSRFGVMFFDDEPRAFANLRRALRPRGRLSFVCWQGLARNPWVERPLSAVMRLLPPEAMPGPVRPECPGPFNFSDRAQAILLGAGFADVRIDRLEQPLHLGGAMTLEEALAYCRQIGPAARAMAEAPPALRPALEEAIAAELAPFVSERGVWMDAAAIVVTAHVL